MTTRELVDEIWDIVHMAGGPFSEEEGQRQILSLLDRERPAIEPNESARGLADITRVSR